jgi:hypothetical protein
MNVRFLCVIALVVLWTATLAAEELPYIYKGPRPLGMGGAFVAVSDDANALFYNPAGLADIKAPRASLLTLEVEANRDAHSMYQDAADCDFDNEAETAYFLSKYVGDVGHAAVSSFPFYVRPQFAFGLVGTVKTSLQVHNPQYPRLIVDGVEDAAVCAGYALPLFDGSLLVGAGAKYLLRRSVYGDYTLPDITAGDFEDRVEDAIQDGEGALVDVGIIYKVTTYQVWKRPSSFQIGLSASNLVGSELGDARDLGEHVDLGLATHIGEHLTIAVDYVDLFTQIETDDDVGKRLHLGFEYRFTDALSIRAGLNQGYLTYGVGFEKKNLQVDLLTYAEEIGSYAGQTDCRRFLFRVGVGF